MSFAKDIKLQILETELDNDCCCFAFFSGLLRVAGEFDNSTQTMSFTTDVEELYSFANKIINKLYGDFAELELDDGFKINKTMYYKITLPKEKTQQMLTDFGLMENGKYNPNTIEETLFQGECCKKSFIKGLFLGSGTSGIKISDNSRTTSGYDIEFVARSHELLLQVSQILAEFNLSPKLIKRKNHFVLYIKESSQVSDLLALLDAFESVIKLQDELATRELRNKVNRQVNCLNANINKTVDASVKQVNAIQTIIDYIGLSELPEDLMQVALLRIANREESLVELLKLAEFPLTKSALNHKLNKLIKIADSLKN